jgi:quercetin dioxygenase-like cupin family protein
MQRTTLIATLAIGLVLPAATAAQQASIVSKPVAEKKVAELPKGPLFWRVEKFPDKAQAQAGSSPHGLVVEAFGNVWLFTLGQQGQASPGAQKVADIGPLPEVTAPQYLLRVNEGSGAPGSTTSVHTHPGSEAYFVLEGEASQKTPHGVSRISAGQTLAGHGPDTVMQFINSGTTDVKYFALFVVDATKPFTTAAKFD